MSMRAAPGEIQSVLGPIAPGDLGFTLPRGDSIASRLIADWLAAE